MYIMKFITLPCQGPNERDQISLIMPSFQKPFSLFPHVGENIMHGYDAHEALYLIEKFMIPG